MTIKWPPLFDEMNASFGRAMKGLLTMTASCYNCVAMNQLPNLSAEMLGLINFPPSLRRRRDFS